MRLQFNLPLLRALILAGCGLTAAASTLPLRAEFTVRPIPFIYSITDTVKRPSGLCLGIDEERYGKSASEVLGTARKGSADGVAWEVLEAIGRKDFSHLRNLMVPASNKRLAGNNLGQYLSYFGMPPNPIVERIYRLGTASFYVVRRDGESPLMPILIVKDGEAYRYDVFAVDAPPYQMVWSLNLALTSSPSIFAPITDRTAYQVVEVPLDSGDATQTHPIRVYFKGMRYVAQVYPMTDAEIKALPKTGNPSMDGGIRFYVNLWQTLTSGNVKTFADMHWKGSADWIRKANVKQLAEFYLGKYHSPRQINYAIYSDNVFYLVYQFFAGPYRGKSLTYDVVVWDGPEKSYKLARERLIDPFDSFLHWPELQKRLIDEYIAEPTQAGAMSPEQGSAKDSKIINRQ